MHQPYAGLIQLAGLGYWGKELEVRSISTTYRGKLVITAARRIDHEAYNRVKVQLVSSGLVPADVFEAACGAQNCGKAVALFEVRDSRRMKEEDHALAFTANAIIDVSDRHVWCAEQIDALEPFDVIGKQGFFRVSRPIVDAAIKHSTTRAGRIEIRAKAKRRQQKPNCPCGFPLPTHLAEFMNNDARASHMCRCGKEYVVKRGKFVIMTPLKSVEVAHGA